MIRIENLYKSFGPLDVLKALSLTFNQAGIYAILGPNGSGKTTLIKSIMGMVHSDLGNIIVGEQKLTKTDSQYRKLISYVPQIARFPENLTVIELIKMIENLRGPADRKEEMIDLFEIREFLTKKFRLLSGGMKQRVNLVVALMHDNPVLILDEPTSGLDPIAMISLKAFLVHEKKRDKIILISSHILSFVDEMADQIVFLLEGRIYYSGLKSDLKKSFGTSDLESAIAHILRGDPPLIENGNGKRQMEKDIKVKGSHE
jgi:Cu-processing system ATP-binding protein